MANNSSRISNHSKTAGFGFSLRSQSCGCLGICCFPRF